MDDGLLRLNCNVIGYLIGTCSIRVECIIKKGCENLLMNPESMRPTPLSNARVMKVANTIVAVEAKKIQSEPDKILARRATIFLGILRKV